MRTLQAPRGMRDLLPADAAAFDALQRVVAARAERYGYPRVVTPLVEDRQVFIKGAGATSDIVSYEMYQLEGDAGLALRPEGTAAVTRAFLEHGMHATARPVRLFYWDPMFRGQRPQLLRYRQFWQWGLECFGEAGPGADVEIIEFTSSLFAEVGLSDVELELNTIGDAACRPKVKEALERYFGEHRDALSEPSQRRLATNALRILDSKDERDRKVIAGAPPLHELLCADDRAHFEAVTSGCDRLGIRYTVVPTLVRGLDYYTRTVCEFILTDEAFRKSGDIAVAAGGRYDELVSTMGGPAVPGVGIAGGVDVLIEALKKQGVALPPEQRADVWIVSAEQDDAIDRQQLAAPLREAGFAVAVELSRRTLDKQLENAAKHGATVAVIRGTPEARGGNVVVRDLASGEQRVTRLAAVVTEVGRRARRRDRPALGTQQGEGE